MDKAGPQTGQHSPSSVGSAGGGEGMARADNLRIDIAQLVAEHHAAVYRYAYRLTGSAADADDLSQQAFLLAHQRLAQLRDDTRAGGWLMAIVRNCFLKNRRRIVAKVEPLDEEPAAAPDDDFPEWVDPEQLQQVLSRLPDDARAILVLFFFEDCSYKEIAEALEVPIGTVMSRLSRAKARLRQELVSEKKLCRVCQGER